ncbi:hypothetical protein CH305_18320 [Rhodococcus sp. 15-649-2-2]|uniref:hypothetical protein n=1 Tax=Rhodococcus sp. 15-649-2-2 TaxID=2023140 RepID=UPI000B9C56DB|nr:hypothetical protein [Rhodococcus sp. 15-649-2-2]OZE77193.1 hypothetical protein CH305_18320 [Rhodococcus sp. 15-649-2-2]
MNPTHIIAEALLAFDDGTAYELAAHAMSKLTEHGYSIIPTPRTTRFGHEFIGSDPECCCAGIGAGELCGYPIWKHTAFSIAAEGEKA